MSVRVSHWVWQYSPQKGSALLVLLAIADSANDDGGGAYPSTAKLAKKSRLSERNVQYIVRGLAAEGAIEIDWGAGPRGTNVYRVAMADASQGGVQSLHPSEGAPEVQHGVERGATEGGEGCNPAPSGGAITVAPNPSVETSRETSIEPSREQTRARAASVGSLSVVSRDRVPVPKPGDVERAERASCPVWAALVATVGGEPAPGKELGAWRQVWLGMRERPDATPAEIAVRAERWKRGPWGRRGIVFTVPGLWANWTALGTEPPPATNGHAPRARAPTGDPFVDGLSERGRATLEASAIVSAILPPSKRRS